MASDQLHITLIQPDIKWEDKQANLDQYEQYISELGTKKQVVVLPEMFSTGFSMAVTRLGEPMDGPTVQWMKMVSAKHRCILTGSLIIGEDGFYFNRLLWVQPDGQVHYYDKRHLFAYADEDEHFTRGEKRVIVQVNGWRINLQVCYDLRFPVFVRNQESDYDVILYVANWPERRSLAWKTLLQARAIENQSFVVGVNRVGNDGNNIHYNGDSSVFGPLGETIWQYPSVPVMHTVVLDKTTLHDARSHFPFLKDVDKFIIL